MTSANGQQGSRRVLYVDRDADFAQLTKWALEGFGLQVTTLPDPTSALRALSDHPDDWDFLIAAVGEAERRELDGVAAIRHRHPQLHCAVVAPSLDSDVARRAEDCGVGPVVRKPATMLRFAALAELALH